MNIYPSNCNTWINCSAFCKATENAEHQPMNINQLEGLALHSVIEQCLVADIDINKFVNQTIHVKNTPVVVTDDMILRASQYLKYISNIRCKCKFYGVEFKVNISSIHSRYTAKIDYFQYNESTKTLTVVDYKDGWGKVSPINNYTMLSYVIGILDNFPDIEVNNCEIVIYQPRLSDSPDIFTFNIESIESIRQYLRTAFMRALNGPYVETAGEHCKYCRARNTCRSFNNAIETLYTAYQYEPNEKAYDIGKRLVFLEHAIAMFKSALIIETEIAKNKMKGGGTIDGWGLKESRGSWKFKPEIPVEFIKQACEYEGIKAGTFKLFTPNQLSKAGLSEHILNWCSERVSGKSKLVAVSPEEIKSLFNRGHDE